MPRIAVFRRVSDEFQIAEAIIDVHRVEVERSAVDLGLLDREREGWRLRQALAELMGGLPARPRSRDVVAGDHSHGQGRRGGSSPCRTAARTAVTIIFLDFEASSLNRGSFPIEVGWAVDGGDVEAHLIAPASDWTEWSPKSEAIHGLSLDYLIREGRVVAEVAARVLEVFSAPDAIVASDNPRWEQMWLDRLMKAADCADHGIHVQDAARIYVGEGRRLLTLGPAKEDVGYRYVADRLLDEAVAIAADCQHAEAQRHRSRHRAGPDAEGGRWILEEVRRRIDARLGAG